jgi:hypothetical protein
MTRSPSWRRPIAALVACHALLGANLAVAAQSTEVQAAYAQEIALQAIADGEAGHNLQACQGFRNAEALYKGAMNSLYSHSLSTPDDRKYVTDSADFLQLRFNAVKEGVSIYCGLPDETVQATTSSNDVDSDADSKLDLQRRADLAQSQYKQAARLYEANDFAGACASVRLSAAGFGRVVDAMKANHALESAFANAAQIYSNAAQAAADRDEFYCKA